MSAHLLSTVTVVLALFCSVACLMTWLDERD
jgi:hypothetical protein